MSFDSGALKSYGRSSDRNRKKFRTPSSGWDKVEFPVVTTRKIIYVEDGLQLEMNLQAQLAMQAESR